MKAFAGELCVLSPVTYKLLPPVFGASTQALSAYLEHREAELTAPAGLARVGQEMPAGIGVKVRGVGGVVRTAWWCGEGGESPP